jgi:NADPH:quinone reductase
MPFAIQVVICGGPEVMQWQAIEVPAPESNQVVLEQVAVGVNYIDIYHRSGLYPQRLPFIPGVAAAGRIQALGSAVKNFKVGDRVAYVSVIGSYTEQRTIAAERLLPLPAAISFEAAAAGLLQGMTVQMLIKQTYSVKSGDVILVHAAAGGVGLLLCQWAKALGAVVIGTVSTAAKAELAAAHGCDYPLLYTQQDFVAEVLRITQGQKLAVVYDSVGKDTFLKSLDCLRPRGLLVSFGQASGAVEPFSPLLLTQKGSLYLTRPTLFDYTASLEQLNACAADFFQAVQHGLVTLKVGQTYALRDAAEAHRALAARETSGSTALIV